jgi:hypothetical protein
MLEHQVKVWELITAWMSSTPSDQAKAYLRERIRRSTLTRRGRLRGLERQAREQARAAYHALEPNDLVIRHQWLFADQWVEESFEEIEKADFDVERWETKVVALRTAALREIWSSAGHDGILRLCEGGNGSYAVGRFLVHVISTDEAADFVDHTFKQAQLPSSSADRCVSGILDGLDDNAKDDLVDKLLRRFSTLATSGENKKLRLLLNAPFRRRTWLHVNALQKELSERYWKEVYPQWAKYDRDEYHELITRLLEVNRPRAAFSVIHMNPEEVEPTVLLRLMTEVATNNAEPHGHYMFQSYDIARALKALDRSAAVSDEQMAQLEFFYLSALTDDQYGIPHLEAQLSQSPAMFMQAIGLCYKRSDDGEDPPEWRPAGIDGVESSVANQAYRLLKKARRIPGTQADRTIKIDDLKSWISEITSLCKKYAREKVGEHVVGEFLARCAAGEDGIWPCEPVRQAIEELGTEEILEGMIIGAVNSRGAVWHGEGGHEERQMAAKYRLWARQTALEYPVTSRLLEQVAAHYDHDARWHDNRADLRRRVGH